MKKFIYVLLVSLLLISNISVLAADKVHLSENLIVEEHFDTDFTFGEQGKMADGKWERIAAGLEETVTHTSDGTVQIVGNTSGAVGVSYFLEPQENEMLITFKAKKTAGSGVLRLQIYYNKEKTYRVLGWINDLPTTWTDVLVRVTQGQQVLFYTKAEGATAYTYVNKYAAAACNHHVNQWDQVKFFDEKSGSTFEIDDVKIVSYNPKNEGIYFNEDFDSATDLSSRGFGIANGVVLETEANGNKAIKLTRAATTDAKPKIYTNAAVEGSEVSSSLPEEFYLTMKVKDLSGSSRLDIQFYYNASYNADANSAYDVAARRIQCVVNKNNSLFGVYNIDNGLTSMNTKGLVKDKWVDLVYHITGDTFKAYIKSEDETSYTQLGDGAITAQARTNNFMNQLVVYTDGTCEVLVDDIRIFTPGWHVFNQTHADGKAGLELINGTGASTTINGIFAAYNADNMLTTAATTSAVTANAYDATKLTADVSEIGNSTRATFYLWKDLSSIIPVTLPIDFTQFFNCLEL